MSGASGVGGAQAGLRLEPSLRLGQRADAHEFRRDVEGLRGIAVLSVLAVHAFPQWMPGGFIGVDIFFVLSGFLIAGIVQRDIESGRFSVAAFYERRVRRLLPALCVVLAACLVTASLWTFPNEARQIGKHVAAGASFVSNIVYRAEAGYFDAGVESKPLLHLWSLAIEEQFYLLWPLAALGLARWQRLALPAVGAALIASFALNVHLVDSKPVATFFLLPTRAWELLAGVLLAYASMRASIGAWLRHSLALVRVDEANARHVLAAVGALLLVAALCMIDKSDQFPGWWATLPVAGTLALLAAGPQAGFNRHVLGVSVVRFYGSISYPLYLWHWPLLSFPVLMGVALTPEVRVLILVASVTLATLTLLFIERPLREGRLLPRHAVMTLLATLAAIGVAGWAVHRSDGLLRTHPPGLRELAATEFRFDYTDYRVGRCMVKLDEGPETFGAECVDREPARGELVMLWGDSHAAALYPGLRQALTDEGGVRRLAQFTAARCPPLLSPPEGASRTCESLTRHVLDRVADEPPHTVVLAGYWLRYGRSAAALHDRLVALRDTAHHLQGLGVQRVVVLGHTPVWTQPLPRLLMQQHARTGVAPARMAEGLDPGAGALDAAIESALSGTGAVLASPHRALCTAQGCESSLVGANGAVLPLMADESHLTREGSVRLVSLLAELRPTATGGGDHKAAIAARSAPAN
jgi:peptidoglycan/LPS O-acetylase OafA/YrhL